MVERNEVSYQLEQHNQIYILTTSLLDNKLKLSCEDSNSEKYIGEFTMNDLVKLSRYFSTTRTIEQVQNYLNGIIEKQRVSISLKDNTFILTLYLVNQDKINIPLKKVMNNNNNNPYYNYEYGSQFLGNQNQNENIIINPPINYNDTNYYKEKQILENIIPNYEYENYENKNESEYLINNSNYQPYYIEQNNKNYFGGEKQQNIIEYPQIDSSLYKNNDNKIKSLEEENIKFKKEYELCKKENEKYKNEMMKYQNEIKIYKNENDSFRNQLSLINNDINDYQNNIEELKKENQNLKEVVKELKENMLNITNENISLKNEVNHLKNHSENFISEEEIKRLIEENNIFRIKLQENELLKKQIEDLEYQIKIGQREREEERENEEAGEAQEVKGDIIHDMKELEMLTKKINKENKKIIINLLYKASADGDKASAFHEKCDEAKSSIVLVETKDGKRFGGFTTCSWSGNCVDKNDPKAFIFSFDKMKTYDNIPGDEAIGCYPKFGPIFLGCQIKIFDDAFAKGGTTFEKELNFNTEEDYELTGGKRNFEIKDIEVYEVTIE